MRKPPETRTAWLSGAILLDLPAFCWWVPPVQQIPRANVRPPEAAGSWARKTVLCCQDGNGNSTVAFDDRAGRCDQPLHEYVRSERAQLSHDSQFGIARCVLAGSQVGLPDGIITVYALAANDAVFDAEIPVRLLIDAGADG